MTAVLEARPGTPVGSRRAIRRRLGLFSAITILAASNVVSNRIWPEAYIPWNLAIAAILLILARRSGLSWADLGLANARLRRGLVIGGLAAGLVGMLYLVALAIPATQAAFLDSRAAGPLGAALFAALIRIPLGTVVLEETAFRGVLPALIPGSWWRGALVSSALFGLWHVLPSLGMAEANAAVGAAVGGWGAVLQTGLAVLFTFAAGMLMCAWRRWSGHLVTPMLAHMATNSLGVLLAWWIVAS
ncbi:CPBP family intramembrane glutamic endopeptidase [Pseudonocardia asaccharolytica]|uniref:Abortive infection protein n=1 Tax=Pseudonocardia asaccharolytica DSM 44247 = NBRC 16224 TaxID=1123024 RepID=A0A511D3U9_9PSEU|nr:CPBP family intramembrane glutamic endopeptidase [Pseudonocardia asaccharolytica]GEL19461.1 abortive infection protein [Pseudonocardia asaccharolytica DSM 44247 = NBRC 16224]